MAYGLYENFCNDSGLREVSKFRIEDLVALMFIGAELTTNFSSSNDWLLQFYFLLYIERLNDG